MQGVTLAVTDGRRQVALVRPGGALETREGVGLRLESGDAAQTVAQHRQIGRGVDQGVRADVDDLGEAARLH